MANEFIGSGVTFGFNSVGSPSVYTTLAGVTVLDVPAAETDDIDVTALDSTGGVGNVSSSSIFARRACSAFCTLRASASARFFSA